MACFAKKEFEFFGKPFIFSPYAYSLGGCD